MFVVFILLLSANCALGVFPILKDVVYDPKDFDVLYFSAKGAFQETWSFTRTLRVTAFILASQVNFCGSNDTYQENITLTITKVDRGVRTLIGEGRYQGDIGYGKEIYVSLFNTNTSSYPEVYSSNIFNYAVKVEFGPAKGIYPWHTSRSFSSTCATSASPPGHIIGIEYTW